MKAAPTLMFALVAAPLMAQAQFQNHADLPDSPAATVAPVIVSPPLIQPLVFHVASKPRSLTADDLFGSAAAFVHDHTGHRGPGFGASIHQDITDRLSLHAGETRLPRMSGQPQVKGYGAGLILKLNSKP